MPRQQNEEPERSSEEEFLNMHVTLKPRKAFEDRSKLKEDNSSPDEMDRTGKSVRIYSNYNVSHLKPPVTPAVRYQQEYLSATQKSHPKWTVPECINVVIHNFGKLSFEEAKRYDEPYKEEQRQHQLALRAHYDQRIDALGAKKAAEKTRSKKEVAAVQVGRSGEVAMEVDQDQKRSKKKKTEGGNQKAAVEARMDSDNDIEPSNAKQSGIRMSVEQKTSGSTRPKMNPNSSSNVSSLTGGIASGSGASSNKKAPKKSASATKRPSTSLSGGESNATKRQLSRESYSNSDRSKMPPKYSTSTKFSKAVPLGLEGIEFSSSPENSASDDGQPLTARQKKDAALDELKRKREAKADGGK